MSHSTGFTTRSHEEIVEILRSEFDDRLVARWEAGEYDLDVEERYEEIVFGYE